MDVITFPVNLVVYRFYCMALFHFQTRRHYDKLLRVEGCYQSLTDDFFQLSAKYSIILLKCTLKHDTIISKKKLVKMIA